ncbi:MAG TPA: peptidylprolyl isomerase [Sediminibacterium sp.]|nr:peptidylprolyl isomerase [Sediminibacterium sp.]HQS56583.1 peptidylprolyl isomerase [Sediminibacterium sp.]
MKSTLKKIIREPLFHFLLIGAVVFVLYYLFNPVSNTKQSIVIDDELVNRIGNLFEKQWGRQPNDSEWTSLIDNEIREEVYYRQALKMNLDHNDELIRRRMNQKLDFITSDLVQMKEPEDSALQAYYLKHKSKYLLQASYTFSHIYFNADKRAHAKADALALLPSLPSTDNNLTALTKLGDSFAFAYHTNEALAKEIDAQMGQGFAAALAGLPVGKWSGPILSGFGAHLIFINAVKPATEPDFASIKEQLLNDYRYDFQQQFNQKVYDDFKKEYTLKLTISNNQLQQQLTDKLMIKNAQ